MFLYVCPVCGGELFKTDKIYRCNRGHCFDEAKEGYVNLLTGTKSGSAMGDSVEMARSRRQFLSKGYYDRLGMTLCKLAEKYRVSGNALDICCGEGHYSAYFSEHFNCDSVWGFDLSREMVRLAAKQSKKVHYFVANMTKIPVPENSVDFAFQLFSPFCEKEFYRVMKDGGILVSAVSGKSHLIELKEVLYDSPYKNELKNPSDGLFMLIDSFDVTEKIQVDSNDDLMNLFKMTPYYCHTPASGVERLACLDELGITVQFHMFVYRAEK